MYLILKQYKNSSTRCVVGEGRQGGWEGGSMAVAEAPNTCKGFFSGYGRTSLMNPASENK